MDEIQIRPHTQTTAVSIRTTASQFGSGSLLGLISYRFGIWCPRASTYFAGSRSVTSFNRATRVRRVFRLAPPRNPLGSVFRRDVVVVAGT
jgi:hypothetical protein